MCRLCAKRQVLSVFARSSHAVEGLSSLFRLRRTQETRRNTTAHVWASFPGRPVSAARGRAQARRQVVQSHGISDRRISGHEVQVTVVWYAEVARVSSFCKGHAFRPSEPTKAVGIQNMQFFFSFFTMLLCLLYHAALKSLHTLRHLQAFLVVTAADGASAYGRLAPRAHPKQNETRKYRPLPPSFPPLPSFAKPFPPFLHSPPPEGTHEAGT